MGQSHEPGDIAPGNPHPPDQQPEPQTMLVPLPGGSGLLEASGPVPPVQVSPKPIVYVPSGTLVADGAVPAITTEKAHGVVSMRRVMTIAPLMAFVVLVGALIISAFQGSEQFSRVKDVFVVVAPILTFAMGKTYDHWFPERKGK